MIHFKGRDSHESRPFCFGERQDEIYQLSPFFSQNLATEVTENTERKAGKERE
jgi:hypothetical protein